MLLPIIAFFIAYKLAGIFVATGIMMAVSLLQVSYHWMRQHTLKKTQLAELTLVLLFGGATLLLHDELFIKWKLTIVYWVLALLFLMSHLSDELLIQRIIDSKIEAPPSVWKRLNISWAIFFLTLGGFNLYIVYQFSTNIWVNFKLFGTITLTLLFTILQGAYLLYAAKIPKTYHTLR